MPRKIQKKKTERKCQWYWNCVCGGVQSYVSLMIPFFFFTFVPCTLHTPLLLRVTESTHKLRMACRKLLLLLRRAQHTFLFLSHILLHLPSSSSLFEYKWGIHCCNSVKMMDGFDDAFACCSNVKLVQLGWEMHALNTLNQARGMSREGYCQSKAGGRWQMARHCRCNQCVFVCAESGRNVEMV